MNPNDIPSTIPSAPNDSYAKVTEVAAALNRHERTIRSYIRLLREDFGHPDFLEKLDGRALNRKAATGTHRTRPVQKPKEHPKPKSATSSWPTVACASP